MRCEVARLRLLSVENPARVPADVRAHLVDCEFCRDWHDDLCTFERHIPFLPVPNSRGKAKLLQQLLSEKHVEVPNHPAPEAAQTLSESSALTHTDHPILPHPRLVTFPGLMAGLAAVVLLVLSTWLLHN